MKVRREWWLGLLCSACLLACEDSDSPSDGGPSGSDAGAEDAKASEDAAKDEEPFAIRKVERSGLTDVGTSAPLDYDNPAYWACRPDMDAN